jgi:hypothetical protein
MSSAPGGEGRGGGHRGDGVGDEGRGVEGGGGRGEDASNFWDEALFQVVIIISSLISLSLPHTHIHTLSLCPLSRSSPRIPFSPYGPILSAPLQLHVCAAGTFPLPASFEGRHCMCPKNCLIVILHLLL